MILEVCANSYESAINAEKAGAHRIELCENLAVGGLTPNYKLAKKVLKQKKFDVITAQDQYFLALLAYRLAKQFRNGLEVQVHGFEKFSGIIL